MLAAFNQIAELCGTANYSSFNQVKEAVVGEKTALRPVEPRETYDPSEARDLLIRLLAAVFGRETTFAINVVADGSRIEVPPFSLLYTFEIRLRDPAAFERLETPYEDDFENRTLAGSLDAIWRAYAAKDGVAFAIKALPL